MTEAGTGAARFPALSAVIYAIELAIIAASYFSLAESALLLPAVNPAATPLWPPTGVALAFVLLRGYRVWPAILVSSFFALMSSFSAHAVASGTMTASWLFQSTFIAIGTTLAAVAGAWLINHRSYGTKTFFTPLGIRRFVLIAFVPTAMMSSAGAILGQLATSDLNFSSLVVPSVSWWLADAVGTILIAPVIVLWAMPPRQAVAKWDLLETTAILVAAAVIGAITFIPVTNGAFSEPLSQHRQLSFLILLPLIWAGLRDNQRAAATAALIFCGLAAWSRPDAGGSLAATGLNGSLVFLLALSISTSVASLLLSAVIAGYRDRQEGAKRHFQIFVESVSDHAIFVLDPSGHVASWNSTAEKIIGYTSDEIVGKPFSILYRPDERRARVPNRALELTIQKGRHEVEGWHTRKNGTPFFVTGVFTAIRDDNANLIGFVIVMRDATERRDTQEKLVEAREQLRYGTKNGGDWQTDRRHRPRLQQPVDDHRRQRSNVQTSA